MTAALTLINHAIASGSNAAAGAPLSYPESRKIRRVDYLASTARNTPSSGAIFVDFGVYDTATIERGDRIPDHHGNVG